MMSQIQGSPLIIGIGASAGGLDAMKLFFQGLSHAPDMAFVVITHLDPVQKTQMPEILATYTDLRVTTATDGMLVEGGRVYVAPPGVVMTISGGRLGLREAASTNDRAKAIDAFFSSLADDQGERSAGIVLSGLDGDGTLGIKAIKERNGLTLAEVSDGTSPSFESMPQSAIATGLVDLPLPAGDMMPQIREFARGMGIHVDPGLDRPRFALEGILSRKADICAILVERLGHDFSGYKDQTFARRVLRRSVFQNVATIDEYVAIIRADLVEATALFRDLLISVTDFFRDADAFDALARDVIPAILEGRTARDTVRIWVPGCATGEEVFSLAILLKEATSGIAARPGVQIFATDIDERALSVARAGRFPAPMLKGVSEERRRRFFVQEGDSFVVDRTVREMCIFSAHSVFRDPPFSRVDLVSCRNLLIYFGADVQDQVLPIFHHALRASGYLFLGLSENIGRHSDLFEPLDQKHRVFRAKGTTQPLRQIPVALERLLGLSSTEPRPIGLARMKREAETQILDRHAPQFVVADAAGNVVFFSADTGAFLRPSPGAPSRALVDLVRTGARPEVRSALREVAETGQPARRRGLVVEDGGGRTATFDFVIERFGKQKDEATMLLAVFAPVDDAPPAAGIRPADDAANDLEAELREARDRLQAALEQYEASTEELRSSNEELTSLNEEYQSAIEELETSREEMQSLNEELQTVNSELKNNIAELDAVNADLRHFFESTDVATVFLDGALTIRNYTPSALELFRMKPSDKGRPLADLSTRLDYPRFEADLHRCLDSGTSGETEVATTDGSARFLVRVRPYAKLRDGGNGLIVTVTDVTELADLRARLAALESTGEP